MIRVQRSVLTITELMYNELLGKVYSRLNPPSVLTTLFFLLLADCGLSIGASFLVIYYDAVRANADDYVDHDPVPNQVLVSLKVDLLVSR